MLVNRIIQNTYYNTPQQITFAKKKQKTKVDTFERQKEPYSVENSVDAFSSDLYNFICSDNKDKHELKRIMRTYVPRTKVEDNVEFLDNNGIGARYQYKSSISKDKKLHHPLKKIIIDMSKLNESNADFFNDVVHEMIHNLQQNEEDKIFNKIYSDFFKDSYKAKCMALHLSNWGTIHAENLISEAFDKISYNYGFMDDIKYKKTLNCNIKKGFIIPKNEKDTQKGFKQIYDLFTLATLAKEKEAYKNADKKTQEYYKINCHTKDIDKMFDGMYGLVLNHLKKTGMSEEKIEEYKELILN